ACARQQCLYLRPLPHGQGSLRPAQAMVIPATLLPRGAPPHDVGASHQHYPAPHHPGCITLRSRMTTTRSQPLRLLLVCVAASAVGCATAAPRAAPAQPAAQPANAPAPLAATLPEAIRWVRAAAEHRAIFLQVYGAASERVREAAAGRAKGTWAVILDADETILDNSTYQMRRAAEGLAFTNETWNAWVREERAPALPGTGPFLALVRDLGGRIAIVTNRDDEVCAETRRNIAAVGLVADMVLCRVMGASDKNPRFEAVQKGTAAPGIGPLDVVLWIGDNIQDFPRLSQEIHQQPPEALAAFGRTYFVLPNPMYGSWERLPVP
ncbi:MAG: 5'-nucleotidase, lipoprotein e(P4) family, partial [Acidobacteriota bacterium]